MKYLHYISILALCFTSCSSPETTRDVSVKTVESNDTLDLLVRNNWNIVIEPSDSILYTYNKQPLYFKEENTYNTRFQKFNAYFFDQEIARLDISGDTIFLRDTTYYQTADYSFKQKVQTYLIGEIESISKDSLIIKKVAGKGRPFGYNDKFMFYNDSLDYNPQIKLNSIEYSTGSCLGKCPEMAIEIDSKGNYKFFGGEHTKQKGNFRGKVDLGYVRKIEEELRYSNVDIQPTAFAVPFDAPMNELVIYYNDSLRKEIHGWVYNYPPRFQKVVKLMYDSPLRAEMQSVGEQLSFETNAHNRE